MAFGAVVQSNSGTSTTATTTPTLGSATTAGNLIVLHFAADDYNASPNSGWTQSSEMEQQTFHGAYIWWAKATAAMTIPSYTVGSAIRSTWTLVEYEGPFDTSPYDVSEGQFASGSQNQNNPTTPAMTPTAGDRLMVAGLALVDPGNTLVSFTSITNSFTERKASLYNGGFPRISISQLTRVVTANGSTSYSTAGSSSVVADSQSGLIIAFKAGAGGGTTYNDTTAETASAAETAGGLLTTTKAVAETAAAAETATGLLDTVKAVAESASAADTVAGLLAFTGAVAEVASAAEATDASVVPAGAIDVSVSETASAADTVASLLVATSAVAESASANDNVDATGGTLVLPEVPEVPLGGAGPAGEGVRRRFEIYLLPEEDEEDEKPRRKRRLRLKKAEIEEKVEAAAEYIAAGSPQPMSKKAMVAQVSTLMGLDALLERDRRRVERTIYQYLAAILEEEEEEEAMAFLLAA